MANNRVRIVIVGDSGVGKTCLTHLIAHNESLTRPGWTVGCNIQVKIHQFKEGTARQSQYFVELFDIGGSLSHKNTRGVFYSGVHGIILVHDLTNGKDTRSLAAGTTDAVKLSRFFDCVIEKRESIGCSGSHYYGSGSGSGPAGADRRRPPSTATQAAEYSLYGGSSIDAASVMPFLETSDLK
ncbi:GL18279 [Drosophila persimilis]|uniref:GL18279 n=1 Tax=Drosophila persimilis TaxID=7234 RepID=B4H4N2_DROPE|nr:GL18279 [Drosophila persimilis]